MSEYSPKLKHKILSLYSPHQRGSGFDALAARFLIDGGGRTVQRWHERWNGTVESLQHKQGAGRPPLLSSEETKEHITDVVRAANQHRDPIHYPAIHSSAAADTDKQVSLRTIQRYGKEKEGITSSHTTLKTPYECK